METPLCLSFPFEDKLDHIINQEYQFRSKWENWWVIMHCFTTSYNNLIFSEHSLISLSLSWHQVGTQVRSYIVLRWWHTEESWIRSNFFSMMYFLKSSLSNWLKLRSQNSGQSVFGNCSASFVIAFWNILSLTLSHEPSSLYSSRFFLIASIPMDIAICWAISRSNLSILPSLSRYGDPSLPNYFSLSLLLYVCLSSYKLDSFGAGQDFPRLYI